MTESLPEIQVTRIDASLFTVEKISEKLLSSTLKELPTDDDQDPNRPSTCEDT